MPTISYEPFEKLIVCLRADGMEPEAHSIHHLMHKVAWTTGSELLGELGQKINRIREEKNSDLSDETKKKMKEGIQMVRVAWSNFPETK